MAFILFHSFSEDSSHAILEFIRSQAKINSTFLAGQSIVANCSTLAHTPDELIRRSPNDSDIPYSWGLEHR